VPNRGDGGEHGFRERHLCLTESMLNVVDDAEL
jgi:hypothetical protein